MSFKSGFVSILGRPNVGKSTLLNRIIGEKIAIVSPRPQTTRTRIMGVLTDDDSQVVFLDTPGVHTPRNKLGEYMVNSAFDANSESDIVLFLTDKLVDNTEYLARISPNSKVFLIINKIDEHPKEEILPIIEGYSKLQIAGRTVFADIFPISAKTGDGVDHLLSSIRQNLPDGPKYFPDDTLTDQPERVIIAEIIREKCLRLLGDEVPFGIAVEIEEMKRDDKKGIINIRAAIYCEKNSHKAIIIGKNGTMLKEIGSRARASVEKFFGEKVFLQTWVKVQDNWRNSRTSLKNFGYE
ncbi:GTPase Era [Clostridia bacterium]|nr:GTPase Era [Clostridia bacterium]